GRAAVPRARSGDARDVVPRDSVPARPAPVAVHRRAAARRCGAAAHLAGNRGEPDRAGARRAGGAGSARGGDADDRAAQSAGIGARAGAHRRTNCGTYGGVERATVLDWGPYGASLQDRCPLQAPVVIAAVGSATAAYRAPFCATTTRSSPRDKASRARRGTSDRIKDTTRASPPPRSANPAIQ